MPADALKLHEAALANAGPAPPFAPACAPGKYRLLAIAAPARNQAEPVMSIFPNKLAVRLVFFFQARHDTVF